MFKGNHGHSVNLFMFCWCKINLNRFDRVYLSKLEIKVLEKLNCFD